MKIFPNVPLNVWDRPYKQVWTVVWTVPKLLMAQFGEALYPTPSLAALFGCWGEVFTPLTLGIFWGIKAPGSVDAGCFQDRSRNSGFGYFDRRFPVWEAAPGICT